ncbi:MAG: MotE family protein [Planctomycetota bacterium]|jgi:hypothetical protein
MKLAWIVFLNLLFIHVLGLVGFGGWLYFTGRIDVERIQATVDQYTVTIAEERRLAEETADADALRLAAAEREVKVANIGSADERLQRQLESEELQRRSLERTAKDIESLQQNLQLLQVRFVEREAELKALSEELDRRKRAWADQINDEGFKKQIELYETIPAKQTKDMFGALMNRGQTDEVVAFLEAMEPRKAASVLKEFKSPTEIAQAVELTQSLRTRGSKLTAGLEHSE